MLQRAASNAYSWWWASHIRTKQSKWLDNSLQDMEDKVKSMLKIIEEDGDTFAKKAEMYFKRRPELIGFVQESYKSYRALAERYDHLSGELHKANNTIATVFPDQVQFGMDDEDDDEHNSPKAAAIDTNNFHNLSSVTSLAAEAAVVSNTDSSTTQTDQGKQNRDESRTSGTSTVDKAVSAQAEINTLQREILILQTEKEFLKSSHEIGLAKYWDIEKRITEMQERVCNLQDGFRADAVIEDDDARALMTVTALKSCKDTLVSLHEQQKRSMEEASIESQRIQSAKDRLEGLTREFGGQPQEESHYVITSDDAVADKSSSLEDLEKEVHRLNRARLEIQVVFEKARENFEMNSEMSSLHLAEKIDELVSKVFTLESTVSSQVTQIHRLRLENDWLQRVLQSLEEEKATWIEDAKESNHRLSQAEEELKRIQNLDECVQRERSKLQKDFIETCDTFSNLSDKLQFSEMQDDSKAHILTERCDNRKSEKERVTTCLGITKNSEGHESIKYASSSHESGVIEGSEDATVSEIQVDGTVDYSPEAEENGNDPNSMDQLSINGSIKELVTGTSKEVRWMGSSLSSSSSSSSSEYQHSQSISNHWRNSNGDHDSCPLPNWPQLFLNGLEDREKVLLAEYTSILRNFKDAKRKLAEAEKKNQDNIFETTGEIRDLKSTIVMKDDEIRLLRQQLSSSAASQEQNPNDIRKEEMMSSGNHSTFDQCSGNREVSFCAFSSETSGTVDSQVLKEDRNEKFATRACDGEQAEVVPLVEDFDLHPVNEAGTATAIEEKFRRDIDELLEENLAFWLRFSSSIQQIQKYGMVFNDIQTEIPKLENSKKHESGSSSSGREHSTKPEATTIDKKLSDLDMDLSVWIEQNALLKEELQSRFSSLCNIKEELLCFSKQSSTQGKEGQFSAYQASKFQGEVQSMILENNKVADELQLGLDHVRGVQGDVHKAQATLRETFELSSSKSNHSHHHYHFKNFSSRTRVPLRSFLFGTKPKKQSLFSCINPTLQKQHSDLSARLHP